MSDVQLDISEWTDFDRDLLEFVKDTMPRETKKFMRREGGKLRTASRRQARATIKKKTGNYLKGIKNTKGWKNSQGDYGVKVNARAPHSHLLEAGHYVFRRGKNTGKRTRAFYIMRDAKSSFEGRFWNDAQEFIYKLVDNGLKGR